MTNAINPGSGKPNNDQENSTPSTASGAHIQKPLDEVRDQDSDSNHDVYDANGILGDKAEKYIREAANIEDLPGDEDEEFEETDDESIELEEEIVIDNEETIDNDLESLNDHNDDFDSEAEEDDDIL